MSDAVAQVHRDLRDLKSEVSARFNAVQKGLEGITAAMRELVRLDGDIRVISEAMLRIGKESEDHEKRLRVLESKPARRYEKLIDRVLMVGAGSLAGYSASLLLGGA